ncbi:MAG: hypothetical protein ABI741_15285 [Ferruginibacter sp.]
MKSKTLIGGLIAGVISFLLGWLVFGMLLKGYYDANMMHYPGLTKANPYIPALIIANLAWGMLLAYIMDISGANSMAKGFTCGLIIFFFVTLGADAFSIAFMRLIRIRLALVDIAVGAVFGGVVGSVVGWWYGRGNKSTA